MLSYCLAPVSCTGYSTSTREPPSIWHSQSASIRLPLCSGTPQLSTALVWRGHTTASFSLASEACLGTWVTCGHCSSQTTRHPLVWFLWMVWDQRGGSPLAEEIRLWAARWTNLSLGAPAPLESLELQLSLMHRGPTTAAPSWGAASSSRGRMPESCSCSLLAPLWPGLCLTFTGSAAPCWA